MSNLQRLADLGDKLDQLGLLAEAQAIDAFLTKKADFLLSKEQRALSDIAELWLYTATSAGRISDPEAKNLTFSDGSALYGMDIETANKKIAKELGDLINSTLIPRLQSRWQGTAKEDRYRDFIDAVVDLYEDMREPSTDLKITIDQVRSSIKALFWALTQLIINASDNSLKATAREVRDKAEQMLRMLLKEVRKGNREGVEQIGGALEEFIENNVTTRELLDLVYKASTNPVGRGRKALSKDDVEEIERITSKNTPAKRAMIELRREIEAVSGTKREFERELERFENNQAKVFEEQFDPIILGTEEQVQKQYQMNVPGSMKKVIDKKIAPKFKEIKFSYHTTGDIKTRKNQTAREIDTLLESWERWPDHPLTKEAMEMQRKAEQAKSVIIPFTMFIGKSIEHGLRPLQEIRKIVLANISHVREVFAERQQELDKEMAKLEEKFAQVRSKYEEETKDLPNAQQETYKRWKDKYVTSLLQVADAYTTPPQESGETSQFVKNQFENILRFKL